MLSAEMASSTPTDSRLMASDRSKDPRMPVTMIGASAVAEDSPFVFAAAMVGPGCAVFCA